MLFIFAGRKKVFLNPPYGSEHKVDITESAQFPTGILIFGCIRAEWKTRLKVTGCTINDFLCQFFDNLTSATTLAALPGRVALPGRAALPRGLCYG